MYEKYVEDMLKPQSRERLRTLLQSSDVSSVLQVRQLHNNIGGFTVYSFNLEY